MGNHIEQAGAQQAEGNPAVHRVEAKRDPGKQYRAGPHSRRTPLTWPHPTRLPTPPDLAGDR